MSFLGESDPEIESRNGVGPWGRVQDQKSYGGGGTSLVVQWLRNSLAMQRTWVRFSVRKLKFHMLQGC